MKSPNILRALLAVAVLGTACATDEGANPTSPTSGRPALAHGQPGGGGGGGSGGAGGGPPGPGGGDETMGNNLSVPVIFAEGYGVTGLLATVDDLGSTGLRTPATGTYATLPDYTIDAGSPTVTLSNGATGYCQQTGHTWMAQWASTPTPAVADWGDNLVSQQFTSSSIVRVEVGLLAPTTMTGFNMYAYSGTRRTELQCTDLTENTALQPTVYSVAPRLRIYKVNGKGAPPMDPPVVDLAVDDAFGKDGPGYYRAEINVSGKVVYGYNWYLNQLNLTDKKGWYLVSFSLETADIGGVAVPPGVTLTGVADASAELTSPSETRIWVQVTDSRMKGGRGGGGGGGGGEGE